jgi:uncharacterized protein (DUF885 family)
MTRPIDQLTDAYVDDVAALDPISATAIGIAGHDHELPDLSPDGHAAREALARSAYAAVSAAAPSDEREQVAKDAFLERTGLELETIDAGLAHHELSVISGWSHAIRESFDLLPTSTPDDWENIASRLVAIPQALADYRTTLLEEAGRGRFVARRQYAEHAAQVAGWVRSGYFTNLVVPAPDALRADLDGAAAAAASAYAEFGRFLETEMAPRGREADGVGREHYALASRQFLGATVDLEATYAWGWEELARIEADMATTAGRIVPGGSVADAVAALDADPLRDLGSREAFAAWMQEKSDQIVRGFDGVHFDIDPAIRSLECRVAPVNDGGAWYTPPSEDLSRPGTMWFSFTDDHQVFSTWRETTTVFHEGVPGHHLQCAQAVLRADLLNRWQRLMCWVSGHGEGWALYAERLMDELGYLADPADRLGLLDMQGFRAARVVVDIGVHLELEIPPTTRSELAGRRDLDRRPRARVHACPLADGRRLAPVRGQPLPRLAGPGPVVQGRRADLARGPRRRPRRGPGRRSTSRRSTARRSTSARSGWTP